MGIEASNIALAIVSAFASTGWVAHVRNLIFQPILYNYSEIDDLFFETRPVDIPGGVHADTDGQLERIKNHGSASV